MSARPYHKRYHSDALAGFMALTLEERGAFQTLLDLMYDRQGPIIDNERLLAGYMGVSTRKWRALRADLIEKGKIFVDGDGLLFNTRVEKELENDAKTTRKLAEGGAKGGRTRAESKKNRNENNDGKQASLEPPSSISEAIDQSSVDKSTGGKPPDPIKELFDQGVDMLMAAGVDERPARKMIGLWRKAAGVDGALRIVNDARDKTDPVSWGQAAVAAQTRQRNEHWESIERKYVSGANQ